MLTRCIRPFAAIGNFRLPASLLAVALLATGFATTEVPVEPGLEPVALDAALVDETGEPQVDADGDNVLDGLEQELAQAADDEVVEVIVQLDDLDALGALEDTVGDIVDEDQFDTIDSFTAELTPEQIAELAAHPAVEQIEADEILSATNGSAAGSIGATQARTTGGLTGDRDGNATSYSTADVVIAVIDTGIDATHVDLDGGKVIGWADFVNGSPSAYDDQGHGTHVAASAAGAGDGNAGHVGVAPGAALVGIKVLDSAGNGLSSDVIAGIEWAVSQKAALGIDIINLSLGGVGCSNGTDAVSSAVNAAVNAGIVVMVAAGNEGPAACTIASPAAAANAITIGAVTDTGANGSFAAAQYSSQGPTADGRVKPEVSVPGTAITSARANSTNGYSTFSGTSMATGIASGIAALMLDGNPGASPALIKSALMSTAQDFGATGPDGTFGSGVVNVPNAITFAGGPGSGSFSLPGHAVFSGVVQEGQTLRIPIIVNDPSRGVGISLVHPGISGPAATSPDIDITLRYNGSTKVSAATQSRIEAGTASLSTAGTYELEILGYEGPAEFLVDISGGISVPSSPSPAGLDGVQLAGGSATLNWAPSPDPNVVAYSIRSTNGGLHKTVGASTTSTTVSGLSTSTSYPFQVVAHTLGGSSVSNTVTASAPQGYPSTVDLVDRLYEDFLRRSPHPFVLGAYVNEISSGSMSAAEVADALFDEPEFVQETSAVAKLYFAYFRRIPDNPGLEFWLQARNNGQTLASISDYFSTSPEFITKYGFVDAATFVELVYQNVYQRSSDPQGAAFWQGQLAAGMSPGRMMTLFSELPEYDVLFNSEITVTLAYTALLDRSPTRAEFDAWSAALDGSTTRLDMLEAIMTSPEYLSRIS